MCGIHIAECDNKKRLLDGVGKMVNAAIHRGPDHSDIYEEENLCIGFNRLEIVGSKKGRQPITSVDGSLIMVANGEIYNHKELDENFVYTSTSDLEIIIHLYKKYGEDFLERLEGQFAFIIYDKITRKIFMGRDRWGILPLYYTISPHFVASSSINSIMESGLHQKPQLEINGIMQLWCMYGPDAPLTIFKGIYQVPAGSIVTYDRTKSISHTKFYIKNTLRRNDKISHDEEALKESIRLSVNKRLQGKYGVGVYVSGGLDSSIVAMLAKKESSTKPRLFSITFQDKKFDESYYQNLLANYSDCETTCIKVSVNDLLNNIDECIHFSDSPLARGSPIAMMLLSKTVRESGIKFVLCGEGADELFAGYPVFQKGTFSAAHKRKENLKFAPYFKDRSRYIKILNDTGLTEKKIQNKDDLLLYIREQEIKTKLERYLLANQGDRVSMAHGVELRFPFLDNHVAEIAANIPCSLLLNDLETKIELRRSFEKYLPKEIVSRNKQGYLTPDISLAKSLVNKRHDCEEFSKTTFDKYSIFDYNNTQKLLDNINTEAEARFILFIYSTHKLMNTRTRGKSRSRYAKSQHSCSGKIK